MSATASTRIRIARLRQEAALVKSRLDRLYEWERTYGSPLHPDDHDVTLELRLYAIEDELHELGADVTLDPMSLGQTAFAYQQRPIAA